MEEFIFDVQRFAPGEGGGSSSSSVSYSAANSINAAGTFTAPTYTSSTADENAVLISTTATVSITNPTVTKSGDSDGGDNCNFYGINSAVMAMGGGTTSIIGGTVNAEAKGANGIFSYGGNGGTNGAEGDGTTVIISDTTISTTGDNGGGIMTTGGGNTKAYYLTITTTGQSSAPIRTDRGGGNVTVTGGTYTSSGLGSPAIYSTADIQVIGASLTSNLSEGVCIEGQNSVALTDCTLTASNTQTNGNAQFLDSVILYQSQSGDAADGTSTFSMNGGVLNSKSGHVFHVTNTTAIISLENVTINDSGDGVLLSVCDDGWSGASNTATLNLSGTTYEGDLLVGDDSTLTLNLTNGATLTGSTSGNITNNAGTSISTSLGTINVSLDANSKWYLTEDTYISSFEGTAANIITNGYNFYVNNTILEGTTDPSNDIINNTVDGASVVGTTGDDTIKSTGSDVTINALTGNDSINVNDYLASAVIQYAAGDGNDTITGYTSEDGSFNYKLQITGSAYSSAISGSNVILGVGSDSITIEDAMLTSTEVKGINIDGSYRDNDGFIANSNASVNVYGTSDADSIVNKGQGVTIHALGGNDTIHNEAGSNVYIDAGTGSNEIYNEGGTTGVTIQGSDSADTISNINGAGASINGGGGNDTILSETGNDVSIYGGDGADTISASSARVYVNGEAGADSIISNGINGTTVFGGDGKDTIKNTGYSAYIYGGSFDGNDTDDDDVIDNTGGADVYYNSSQANSAVSIYGGVGADSIKNDGNNVLVEGGDGADTIVNESYLVTITTDGALYDHYEGGQGTTLNGGDGNDFISNDSEKVTIEGGAGNDTVSLGSNSANVIVQYNGDDGNDSITGFKSTDSLRIGDGTGTYSAQTISNDVVIASYGASLTLSGAASLTTVNVLGTYSGDSTESSGIYNQVANTLITGTDNADSISNVGDNVTIQALGGNDTINNTASYTSIIAGDGDDYVNNAAGAVTVPDAMSNVDGAEAGELTNVTILTGDGKDTIINAVSNSVVDGGADDDSINNSGENVSINSGAGDDTVINSANNVTISGGAGSDYIQGGVKGNENIVIDAGDGNNEIFTYGKNVSVVSGTGNDSIQINADSEQVTVIAGDGDDTIFNTATNSFIDGGAGKDFIHNDLASVTIDAGADDDEIEGYGNNISINGGAGADRITVSNSYDGITTVLGGAGNDTITRSSGNVLLQYSAGDGNDVLVGFTASDTLVIGDGTGTYSSTVEGNDLVLTVGEQTIKLTDAATITPNIKGISSSGSTVLGGTKNGTTGDDNLSTTEYDIATGITTIYTGLNGLAGNDRLNNTAALENVTLDGGAGNDYLDNRGANSSLIGGFGDDNISNRNGNDSKVDNVTIDGGAGADVVYNWGDNALINLGDGNDSLYSIGDKATVTGGAGADTISVYGDNASIEGGDGADNITGGGSELTLHGGAGNDTILFGGGSDSIYSGILAEDTEGNNTFHAEYVKDSSIISGAGDDSLYSGYTSSLTANLDAGNNSVNSQYDENATINALGGDDTVNLYDGKNILLDVGDGANRILVSNVNDSTASGYTITSGSGADSVEIYRGSQANVSLGGGNDSITNRGANSTINGGDGNDWIYNGGGRDYDVNSTLSANNFIEGGAGNDSIENLGDSVTIDGGEGADYIYNQGGDAASLVGGAGNDTIYNVGNINQEVSDKSTIDAGEGDDYIYNTGTNVLINYTAGDGNDTIAGFDSTTTLSIGGGTYSTVTSGDDVIVTVGDGKITLGNAASLETLNIVGGEAVENWATVTTGTISTAIDKSATVASGTTGDDTIKTEQISGDTTARLIEGNGGNDSILNFVSNVTISGGADKDSVVSSADNVVIQTGGGNDYIQGATKGNVNITIDAGDGDDEIDTYGTNTSINGGAGNDSIKISADSEKVTVIAGEGSDTVVNTATDSFIDGGAGADSIHNDSGNVTIDAGADDDVIISYGDKVSISGGAGADKIIVTNSYDGVGTISGGIGDDTVSIGSGNFLLEYTSGDGADVINGFKANDTLYIDGKYSTATIGTDLLVTVGSGILTLQGAATLESVNVLNDDDISAATFVTALQYKTELGYPLVAALAFNPEEYHGFETLPSSYYASSETLTINSSDGLELTGYHYTPENPNDKWVILVHGYGHNHRHMNGFAMQYLTNNYQVLMIDQRAAGDSAGDWLTMGAAEGEDVALWTHKIAELNSNAKIVLHGVSMGAATAMLAAANSNLTNVISLVEDCGYTRVLNLVDVVKEHFPALEDPAFVSLVSDTSGRLTGHKLTEAAPIDSLGAVTIPSMFITGTSDAVITPSTLDTLYAASGAEVKEIFTVAGATHGVSALTDSIGYGNAVFRFNAEAAGEGWITTNVTDSISLRGTKYDDTITSSGSNVTLNTGIGDDTINNNGTFVLQYNSGDGNDFINGVTGNDTLVIGDGTGTYSMSINGEDLIVEVGEASITMADAAAINPIISGTYNGTSAEINNTLDNTLIGGTPADDTISNHGSNVTVNALGGNDFVSNVDNNNSYINGGVGNDYILNSLHYEIVTLDSGQESLQNPYSNTTIDAGAGNDTVVARGGSTISVAMGEGDDYFASHHNYYATIDGGAGNDVVEISEGHHENILGGDGNDTIIGTVLFESVEGDWAMGGYANIDGGAGADYISVGYSDNATINGGDDNDTIIAYGPNSNINGGDGNDVIQIVSNGETTLTSNGTTITGGAGNDTITIGDNSDVVINYNAGEGNDVINGITANDTLVISSDTYRATVSGNDKIISIVGSQNTVTLKDAATVSVNIVGEEDLGYRDKEGTEIENPVAIIAEGDATYYYESVARAVDDATISSTVTVIANSTETSTIDSTKTVAIKFAEKDLGVYSVTGGNFISAEEIDATTFTFDSSKVLSNGGVNKLQVQSGSTATLDNYEVTATSNGYTFKLQEEPFTFNGMSYTGEGTANFDTSNRITLTSGAIVEGNNEITSATGISLAAGNYTLNGASIMASAAKVIYTDGESVGFGLASDTVTYNDMTFYGAGSASIKDDLPTLTAGVNATRDERIMVVLTESGSNTLDGRGFWMTEALSDGITVGAIDNGISAAHIVSAEDFPDDAGKTFSEDALIYGDDSYTVRLDREGIRSIYGISAGSTVRGNSYLDGALDTLGSVLQLAVDGSGVYTFGDKVYTLGGSIDSVNVVALTSRFYNDGSGALRNVYYLNGTISGDFSSAVTINQSSMPIQILGDTNVDVYATDKVKAIDDAASSSTSSSGNASVISGVGNGAKIVSAGGATKVTTNEEGTFVFRSSDDTQQAFTVSGDSSVDFILRNYTDENGNATMQVEGVNNFENGEYSFNSDTAYHGINVGENINSSDELEMIFSDIATFTISDSKVVEVSGIDQHINGLTSDVTVHATNAMTVNDVYANVTGDSEFNILVDDGKTSELVNISSGASVSVGNITVRTDNNGNFTVGEKSYTINDTQDAGVTFTTDNNGEVSGIYDFAGMMTSSAQEITVNGTAFSTSDTDATITSAGVGISQVNGLSSGDTVGGSLDTTTIIFPSQASVDAVYLTVNTNNYTLQGGETNVSMTGNVINGLDSGAMLIVGAAGNYIVNNATLQARVGDIFIGTAEGSAYIYDPNNLPLNPETMTDEEIVSQAGISDEYAETETDTTKTSGLVEAGGSALNGSMALVLDNSNSNYGQEADFSSSTGRKKVTLEGGDQSVKFNDEGGNVAIIDEDASGEKNITLGNGGDLAVIKSTDVPVGITAGVGRDTIVSAGTNVNVSLSGGATKIVPTAGNVTLEGYDASTNAGIQVNNFSNIERAIRENYIALDNGKISFEGVNVSLNIDAELTATVVNFYNNNGERQKVAYTHSGGGEVDESGAVENLLLVGNNNSNKGASRFVSGSGNDIAIGGAGDVFDLGSGRNTVMLSENRGTTNNSGATISQTSTSGYTEVNGFSFGFGGASDKININASANVSYKDGQLSFKIGGAILIVNGNSSSPDLAESADLFDDNNFVDGTTLDEITPITYEQGDYQNLYDTTLFNAKETITAAFAE